MPPLTGYFRFVITNFNRLLSVFMTLTPWHIWAAFLLDLVFGDPKRIPRLRNVVLAGIHFVENFFKEKGALRIGEKAAGALLAIAVIFLSGGVCAFLIFLSGNLHEKIGLVVLLFLAYTTLTMRSFGDASYAVLQSLQKNNLSSARSELSHIIGYDADAKERSDLASESEREGEAKLAKPVEGALLTPVKELTESGIIFFTVLAIAVNSVQGVVAPLLYLSLGGVPLAMAYKAVNTLHVAIGQKDPLYRGLGFASAHFYRLANWIPARIAGVLMAIGATFLFGTGLKTFMILFRNGLWPRRESLGMPGVVLAAAIGMTLRPPPPDGSALPNQALPIDIIDDAKLHHIKDAIKLMGAVACAMLILCLMIL